MSIVFCVVVLSAMAAVVEAQLEPAGPTGYVASSPLAPWAISLLVVSSIMVGVFCAKYLRKGACKEKEEKKV